MPGYTKNTSALLFDMLFKWTTDFNSNNNNNNGFADCVSEIVLDGFPFLFFGVNLNAFSTQSD